MYRIAMIGLAVMVLLSVPAGVEAQAARRARPAGVGGGGIVNLPHTLNDSQGNQWMIYQGGWMRQQGPRQVFGQGGMLMINGNQPSMNNNQGRIDDQTGELLLEGMSAANLTITRRIHVDREQGFIRYIDIIQNPQGQPQELNLTVQSNSNFGVQGNQMVERQGRAEGPVGYVATTHGNGVMVGVFGASRSRIVPALNWPEGNSHVQAVFQLNVPAGQAVAIMHIHTASNTAEQGVRFIQSLDERKLLADLPRELRKMILNFTAGDSYVGDYEVLRGELFDVVELRGGDQVRGTLREQSYQLTTFYGRIELPVERVVGVINVGQYRPRQLVVTSDGEIFGGELEKQSVALELSSGQVTEVPLGQVTRIGYRKRAGEPEEWTFSQPLIMMRSGDRVGIEMPNEPLAVLTRYGALELDPQTIAAVAFQADEHGVHEVLLTDGSRFAGLVPREQFEMTLSGGSGQVVSFPASSVTRLQFAAEEPVVDPSAPRLELVNGDAFIGALDGEMQLDTAFDTLTLRGGEISRLVPVEGGGVDVQVTLWDQTTVSGQLRQPAVACRLNSGVEVEVPVALIQEYVQPLPSPSSAMIERIKAVVAELNAEDWRQRDRAEAQLISMGVSVMAVLRELRADQPPEAQQRIDTVLKQLEQSAGQG
jgi:hypothetical protein